MTAALTDFLLARIAEDEAAAQAASPGPWDLDEISDVWREDLDGQQHLVVGRVPEEVDAAHIARHDPARVLAECEAKRRIVEQFAPHIDDGDGYAVAAEYAVLTVATGYAGHPDYRDEWRH